MKKRLLLFCLITFFILLIVDANYYSNVILEYTELFIKKLFPFTFVIFIISQLLFEYGLLEVIPSSIAIIFLSIISGFPSGGKYISLIDNSDNDKLLKICHFPNPFFVLGSVSSVISKNSCIMILLIIYFSSFIQLIFLGGLSLNKSYSKSNSNFYLVFTKALKESISTLLLIYGSSLFSYLVAEEVIRIIRVKGVLYSLFYGLFDLTKGIFSTSLINKKRIREILILFFLSFGSISIHLQVIQILNNTKYSYKSFLKGRIIGTMICFIVYFILVHS